ncbi:hypothetical protein ATCC90586_005083 [Pythium insidiosum]|nr:hypothetical protein ATCC90586_005083 [Pythium insidiosum]
MLRNALFSIASAWLMTWLNSRGNVFSGEPLDEQSDDSFLLATFISSQLLYCLATTWIQSTLLFGLHFSNHKHYPVGWAYCFWRIARHSIKLYVVALALCLATVEIFRAANLPAAVRQYKPEMYFSWLCSFLHTVGLGVAGRHVYRHETLEGQQSMHSRHRRDGSVVSSRLTWRSASLYWRAWRRVFVVRLPVLVAGLVTLGYVQVLALQVIRSGYELLTLMLGNFFMKILIQTISKHVLLRSDVKNIRTMFLTVSVPTVLIDTQLRVLLQRAYSSKLTVAGTIIMAATMARQAQNALQHHQPSQTGDGARLVAKLLALRAAEVYADMSAEYIAMGSATAILYFFWSHPKYRLGENVTDVDGAGSPLASGWSSRRTAVLILQVVVEVAVDMLSCLVEIAYGLRFDAVRRHSVYLASVFVGMTVGNAIIGAGVYLRPGQ